MRQVSIVMTGGTIESAIEGERVQFDKKGPSLSARIKELAAEFDCKINVLRATGKGSSSFTPSDWFLMFEAIRSEQRNGVTRFIVTHGTDTMHFTLPFLSFLLGNGDVRVCMTGAMWPNNDARSDAESNLISAFAAVLDDRLGRGVYATFAQPSAKVATQVFHGFELMPLRYDESRFRSTFGNDLVLSQTDAGSSSFEPLFSVFFDGENLKEDDLAKARERVFFAQVYPGIDLDLYCDVPKGSIIALEAYHSGTASIEDGKGGLSSFLLERPDVCVALCSVPSRQIQAPYYASAFLKEKGAYVFRDLPPHVLYVGALLSIATEQSNSSFIDKFSDFLI